MTATRPAPALRRVIVAQGETHVSDEEAVVLTTVLGSCVAACFYDPVVRVGGINHYLLATGAATDPSSLQRYGVYAMEVLINAMLGMGAARGRLRARLFGGAAMRQGFRDIGDENIAFARGFLRDERITLAGEAVGGASARRVEFRPAAGLARCRVVAAPSAPAPALALPRRARESLGDVEFF